MASDYETCRSNLEKLVDGYSTRAQKRNEATTRLQLIDEIFFSCLGWDKEDSILEEPYGRDYADYTFMAARRVLIVEAKKEGDYFEVPAGSAYSTARSDYAADNTCNNCRAIPYRSSEPSIFLY